MSTLLPADRCKALFADDKPRVLVVDDDEDTVWSAVMILKLSGYRAFAAFNAETALELAYLHCPGIVLLDLAMPDADGCFLAHELRHVPGMAESLLICVSGYADELSCQCAHAAGCDYHIAKPADWQELLGLMRRKSLRALQGENSVGTV